MSVSSGNPPTLADPSAKATYQDVIDAPEHLVAEIIGGQLHLTPSPLPFHCAARMGLLIKLGAPDHFGDDPSGWRILSKMELHLSEEVVVPDVVGWHGTWNKIDPLDHRITVVPDWVCEILSVSTRQIDLGPKRDIYADHGVGHLWFLDPDDRTLDAYALKDGDWTSVGSVSDQDLVSLPPFESNSFPLGDLWRW